MYEFRKLKIHIFVRYMPLLLGISRAVASRVYLQPPPWFFCFFCFDGSIPLVATVQHVCVCAAAPGSKDRSPLCQGSDPGIREPASQKQTRSRSCLVFFFHLCFLFCCCSILYLCIYTCLSVLHSLVRFFLRENRASNRTKNLYLEVNSGFGFGLGLGFGFRDKERQRRSIKDTHVISLELATRNSNRNNNEFLQK